MYIHQLATPQSSYEVVTQLTIKKISQSLAIQILINKTDADLPLLGTIAQLKQL